MKLDQFIEELEEIATYYAKSEIEVFVQGIDDTIYEKNEVKEIRLVKNRNFEEGESETILFVVI